MHQRDPFYSSAAWQKARAITVARWKRGGYPCCICGKAIDWNNRPAVDHIKSKRDHPHLALDLNNLHVVHMACNTRKGKWVDNNPKPSIGADGLAPGW